MKAILNLYQDGNPKKSGFYLCFIMRHFHSGFSTHIEHAEYKVGKGFSVKDSDVDSNYGRYFEDDYGLILIWDERFYSEKEPDIYVNREIEACDFYDYSFLEKTWLSINKSE